jgi:hypothetical protein
MIQANMIATQWAETIAAITAAFKIHINIGQNAILNTASSFFWLNTLGTSSIPNTFIPLEENAQIRLPSIFSFNESVSLRVSIFLYHR